MALGYAGAMRRPSEAGCRGGRRPPYVVGRMPGRSRPPAAPLGSHDADFRGWTAAQAKRERTRHAANGAEDGHLRVAAAGAEPCQPGSQLEAAAAGHHSAQDGVRGGDGSAAGCRRQGWQDAFWQPLAAAPLAARCGPRRRGCPRFRYGGGGSRGRGECRIAGGGEGEGGETMPDAEASPLPPDEPPAEMSIEG
jgi:hypothetical protein